MLHEQMTFPLHHLAAVVSRIKIMARMDIAERRRPQDGRFVANDDNGKGFDFRVSVIPLIHGEKIVMRVLSKSGVHSGLNSLGFYPEQQEIIQKFHSAATRHSARYRTDRFRQINHAVRRAQ